MVDEVFTSTGKPTLRQGHLTRLTFEVLRDVGAPIKAREAVALVDRRLDPTPREASRNKSGVRRWETYVRWTTSWAKSIGWVNKGKGNWSLTADGLRAMVDYPGDELNSQISTRYHALRDAQKSDEAGTSTPRVLIGEALDTLGPGSWTTYGDLAQLAGLANQGVTTTMRALRHEAAHRVLQVDGTVSPDFTPFHGGGPTDQRKILEDEGLEFDEAGHADLASRITVEELRDQLGVEAPAARAWLVRGNNVAGRNLVRTWLNEGYCSLPATQTRNLAPGLDRAEISAIVETEYADKAYSARADKVTELDMFLNRMRLDDLVCTVSDGMLNLGRINGDPEAAASADERSNLRRPVTWLNADQPIDYSDLSKALAARLSAQRTIVDLTSERSALESLVGAPEWGPRTDKVEVAPTTLDGLRPATDEFAEANLVPRDWVQDVIDLLWERKQLIFYGPPGTGKTYLARNIARHLTGDENVKLVQFHPAYSYEDFFEGYRPSAPSADGHVGFKLTPGPFRRLVEAARENPATPYLLVIDEINRANLAKVFGELYFLLEYRDETIDLLYASGDEAGFSLPDNVFLIGTMNTADRSIALVDAAMRRRFAFVHLHPGEPPTSHLLRRWLEREGMDLHTADLLERLNSRIDDSDFQIGPSYFMRREVHSTSGGLERVWRTAILPLLEEHHYGEGIDVAARYGLSALRPESGPPPEDTPESADSGR